ncbi:hypothetical protein D3C87_1490480 [compost metagenome]
MSFWKRRSRLVMIPTSLLSLSITGIPPILKSFMIWKASATFASALKVTGSWIIPLSERFTFLTSSAWRSMLMFLCSIPIPPAWAMAIARPASVTVSIAAETIGTLRRIFFVKKLPVSTSRGRTSE